MDEEIKKKLQEQDEKLDRIYVSVEKTRKYFLWTMISTGVMFIVPLVGLAIVIPSLLQSLSSIYGL